MKNYVWGDIIKIRIKGYLKNISTNDIIEIDCFGIKSKDKINYNFNNVKTIIKITNKELILFRENAEFKNVLSFIENKKTLNEYYVKENGLSLEINILTNKLDVSNNFIDIIYLVEDSNVEYEYKIEMVEKKWV